MADCNLTRKKYSLAFISVIFLFITYFISSRSKYSSGYKSPVIDLILNDQHTPSVDKLSGPTASLSGRPVSSIHELSSTVSPPLTIGCFPSSRSRIPQTAVQNIEKCKERCRAKYVYFMFYPKSSTCDCRNIFDTRFAREARYCYKNSTTPSVVVGYRENITGIFVQKSKSATSRRCRCSTPSCQSITCDYISEGPGCWIGPKKADIKNYLRRKESESCESGEYVIVVLKSTGISKAKMIPCDLPECVYCVKPVDMYGFWPISDCTTFHPTKLSYNSRRLYEIIPPKYIGNSITVFTKNRRNQTKLLLVGYYRSGSTFTSELFRNHNDAFYLFEPFQSIIPEDVSAQHEEIHEHLINQTTLAMDSLFKCDMHGVPTRTFSRFPQADTSIELCRIRAALDCLTLFTSRCQSQRITVIKSIRARMQSVQALMKSSLPELKVVLLLRDPRGMMNSRFHTGGKTDLKYHQNSTELRRHASMLCTAMASDTKIARELKKEYPNQVVLVHYEDIAKYSDTAADHIYRELGMGKPPDEVLAALKELQSSDKTKKSSNAYGVKRGDSVATAYKWKNSMAYTKVKLIDEACKESYAQLGYRAVNSDQELSDPDNYHREFIPLV